MKWVGRHVTQLVGTVGNAWTPCPPCGHILPHSWAITWFLITRLCSCSGTHSGEVTWPRRNEEAITKVKSAQTWNSDWGSINILSPRYFGTSGKCLTLRFFHYQTEVYIIRLSQALTDCACQVRGRHNTSSMVGAPTYRVSFHSLLLRQSLLPFPFRRSQGNDKNGSP